MEKILFLMRYPLQDAYNLKQKFDGQMQACVDLGYDVYYIAYDEKNYYVCSYKDKSRKKIGKRHFCGLKNYRSTYAFFDLYSALSRLLKDTAFDYIYMRKKLVMKKAVSALSKHKNGGGKLIVEIPSYGVNEAALGFTRVIINKLYSGAEKKFGSLVDLYTLIGNECPDTYKGKPAVEISNGITLKNIPVKKQTKLESEIHILALASMCDWQGYDRIIKGMSSYFGKYRLVLELAGDDFDGSVQRWKKLAEELKISENVVYHGPLYGAQLDEIFDKCHVAAGSMALFRKKAFSASTLKVREYIGRGIPFVYAYDDYALLGDEWFAKKLPADESAADFEQIVSWLENVYNKDGFSSDMRKFADEHLSWVSQFEKVMSKTIRL